ncbi:holo-ACP synthase [Natribacillus halophilus]|uniref:Holo-[acyl-carrier-protein] synthase n=1 Tax=Natribacillus halophilus TaxID=549003 RepID=A0A1G8QIE1_9BACI|nr:holo-ACP synthase [Natribacillus halophilus]SDJ04564.1 holo-[acyl-carrier-protein] synthase [Natribacillus halophilus]
MIVGTGIDIVEFNRMEAVMERQPRFITRILTPGERDVMEALSSRRQTEFLAGRFAVKEALAKANGSGVGASISWKDVEVLNAKSGAPVAVCSRFDDSIHIHASISHSRSSAVGQVILEKAD